MNSTADTNTTILNPESQSLLEAVRAALTERAMWKAEAERLHRLLREQITQNGELTRQGRKLDGEAAPEYVTGIEFVKKLPEGEPVYPKVPYRDTWAEPK